MLRKKSKLLLTVASTLILSTQVVALEKKEPMRIEEKIYVYDVKIQDAFKADAETIKNFTDKATPSDIFKKDGIDNGRVFESKNNNIIVVIKNDKKHIENFNNILSIAYEYAEKNIHLVNKDRLKDTIAMLKLKSEKAESEPYSEYKRLAKKESVETYRDIRDRTSNELDYYELSGKELVSYFIENYFEINQTRQAYAEDDKRLELVSLLKKRLSSHPDIDTSLIEYDITLTELKNLKKLI